MKTGSVVKLVMDEVQMLLNIISKAKGRLLLQIR